MLPNMSDLAMEVRIQDLHFIEVKNLALSGVFRHPPLSPGPSTRVLYFGLIEGLNTQIPLIDHCVPKL